MTDETTTTTALTTVGAKRLLKLAAFLRELPRQKFDFGTFFEQGDKAPLEALAAGAHRCGTVGCAIGWMPAIWPKLVRWSTETRYDNDDLSYQVAGVPELRDGSANGFYLAQVFFGIGYIAAHVLFDPEWSYGYSTKNPLSSNATPKQVAKHIERYVKRNYHGKAKLT